MSCLLCLHVSLTWGINDLPLPHHLFTIHTPKSTRVVIDAIKSHLVECCQTPRCKIFHKARQACKVVDSKAETRHGSFLIFTMQTTSNHEDNKGKMSSWLATLSIRSCKFDFVPNYIQRWSCSLLFKNNLQVYHLSVMTVDLLSYSNMHLTTSKEALSS